MTDGEYSAMETSQSLLFTRSTATIQEKCNKVGSVSTAINKVVTHRQSFKVKCLAPRNGQCKASFKTRDAMLYHLTCYHAKGIKKIFECHLCKRSYLKNHHIQSHVRSVHTGLMAFKCSYQSCSKRFAVKGNLTRHINSVHSDLRPFVCPNPSCSKKFSRKTNLKRHLDLVHSDLAISGA